MSANRTSLAIAALAAVAILAVLVGGSAIDLPFGDDDKPAAGNAPSAGGAPPDRDEPSEQAGTPAPLSDAHGGGHEAGAGEAPAALPDDPDAVRGSDDYALTRPANLRRALAEGKTRMEALRCLKRHLARRVWKTMTSPQTPTLNPPATAAGLT